MVASPRSGAGLRHAQFVPANHHPMHLIGTIGEAQVPDVGVYVGERRLRRPLTARDQVIQ